jgi:hypothetical protein
MERLRLTLGFLGLAAVSTIAWADPPQFVVTRIIDPVFGPRGAAALSSAGQLLLPGGGVADTVIWTSEYGLQSIGPAAQAAGLNSSGFVLGVSGTGTRTKGVWNPVSGWQPLPLPNTFLYAINDAGTVAAATAADASSSTVLFDAEGGTHFIAGMHHPIAINNAGVVVGYGFNGNTVIGSDASSSAVNIGSGFPVALNNLGQVIFATGSQDHGGWNNYLYTPSDGQAHPIPSFGDTPLTCDSGPCTSPTGLNDRGWMVGNGCLNESCSVRDPFLRFNGTYYKLLDLIHPAGYHPTGTISTLGVNDAGQILVNESPGGALLLTPVGRPVANQITSPMGSETRLVAGQTVHATASGTNVTWTVDRIHDGVAEYATGTGSEFTFTVPADSTTQQRIVLTAMSSEGTATVTYPIAAAAGAHITEPSASAKVRAGETVTLRGTGGNIHWAVDRIYDGAGDFAQGDGDEFSFTVPSDSTTAQFIRVTLTSDAGTATRDIPIEPFRVIPYYPGYPELPQVRALPGSRTYSDRNYVVDYLSPNLAGGIALQTANDDKYATSSFWQMLTFSAPAYVYVVWDSRIPTLPAWLNGWELTGETYKSEALVNPRVFRRQVFANETLFFGSNLAPPAAPTAMALVSNYVVIAKPF